MSRVASRFLVVAMATLLASGWLTARPLPVSAAGTISLPTLGVAYTQDFNTLGTLGTAMTELPTGWALTESGGGARDNEAYADGTGSSATGDTYSFGAIGNPERALGGLQSGSLIPVIGASFTNGTGATVSRLQVSYTGEQWRLGALPSFLSGTPPTPRGPDRIDFQYSLDATSLTTGSWINVDALDFVSPTASPVGALDGNAAANRTAVAAAITGISVANGATFWIRWTDFNPASSDDGLAVDDFALTPQPADDVAPQVSTTSPADDAENVAEAANIDVTFSEPVNTSAAAFDIACDSSGSHTAALSGGPTTWTLNPDTDFEQLENCTVTVDGAGVTDLDTDDPPDNMTADYIFGFQVGPECDDTYTPIYQIQGSGSAAAITGDVTVEGVVVGDFEGPTSVGLQGFYLQDATGDGDPTTSDGIFVFTGNADNSLTAGQVVRVNGFARERFNQTAINGSNSNGSPVTEIFDCGVGSTPAPVDVTLPFPTVGFPERFEGMLVRFPQALTISEYFNYDRFGEIVLTDSRLFTPTGIVEPGAPAQALAELYSRSRITLDDGLGSENPSFTRHPNGLAFTLENRFRGGDAVTNTVGVLGFDFSLYRIQPTTGASHTAANPRPVAPESVDGDLKVAAMNALNFFITADYPTGDPLDNKCGPGQNVECRGWDFNQPTEFDRQRDKLLAALSAIDGDVVGLNEIENTTGVDPLGGPGGLVTGLNSMMGAGTYDHIDTAVIGTDAIRVGFIYKPGAVTPVGDFAILDKFVDPRFNSDLSRPALAQTFEENATGERFTVVVNHLKSKGSDCNAVGDPDVGDGQGNCNQTRLAAAEALIDWLATDPTGSGDPDFLIAGDLNSYAEEDPIQAILDAGYTNLISEFVGPFAYSFVFDAQVGYLDHGLSNSSLTGQVTGATEWHINADEPDLIDYDTSFKSPAQDAIYAPDAYRSSDHDPLIVGLDLNAPPVFEIVAGISCSTTGRGGSFLVTVDDLQTAPGDLTLALTGNTNPTLVPNSNVSVSGGASRTIAIDAASNRSGSAVLTFSLSDGVNTVTFDINVQVGTDLDDTLTGTAGADLLIGGHGSDDLSGLGGPDVLCGGNGADTLTGGDGNDALDGGRGADVLSGGDGDDSLVGGQGIDTLTGGADADAFSGGGGADTNTDFTPADGDTSDGT